MTSVNVATQCACSEAANGRRYLKLKAFRHGHKSALSDWLISPTVLPVMQNHPARIHGVTQPGNLSVREL